MIGNEALVFAFVILCGLAILAGLAAPVIIIGAARQRREQELRDIINQSTNNDERGG